MFYAIHPHTEDRTCRERSWQAKFTITRREHKNLCID